MKIVIIGGVAVGATAATRIRRLDESAQIVLFERTGYVSYANCGLPYYVGGVIDDPDALTLQTPEALFKRFRIDARTRCEVVAINRAEKTVDVLNLATGERFVESYDKLVLAPGAKPVLPPLAGVDLDEVFTLRTVEDALKIREFVESRKPASAILAGGGFISLELAENLRERGLDVTIVQRGDQLMTTFDAEIVPFIHATLRQHGVKLALGRSVTGFRAAEGAVDVLLDKGAPLRGEFVGLAIGVTPDSTLAKNAGLALGAKDAVLVDDRMTTSDPDIYAGGDAVLVKHYVSGEDALVALAGPANKHGRIIADNICGKTSRYLGSQGSAIFKLFDATVGSTGLGERAAKLAGYDVETVVISPASHAGYYPGAKMMTMKIVFDRKSFALLGAQIFGYDGVDKRLDVLATAIRARMRADDLKDLDLAYAPPYSSAKDPVNMAGFVADNVARGVVKQWGISELADLPRDGSVSLLDARTPREYALGHVEGFVNIPVDELRERVREIEKGKPVYVMCQSGLRSYVACRILHGCGYDAYNFKGGYRLYAAIAKERALAKETSPCGADA
ncbi:MAG: FAD-dependent oxidoreductase [Thermoguttaceae bacterium]